MGNKNVPDMRFTGYNDDWKQVKLTELLFPADERNNAGKYTQDDVLAASLGTELVKKHIFFGLRSTEESVKNYRVVSLGDVVYTKSPIKGYPNGIIRANKGLEGIVPSLYCVYRSVPNINTSFIQSYFEDKSRLDAYLYPLVNIGARNNVNITDLGFLEGTIYISNDIDEQNNIVAFLNHFSQLITIYQQELTTLKQTKQGFLQKMFPKEGETVPELRFPGFSSEWELCDFGDILKINSGRDYKHLKPGEIPVYGTGGYMLSVNESLSDENAIGIGRKGTINKPQLLTAPFWTVDTLFYMTVKNNNVLRFCYTLTNNIYWKKHDESTGVPSLSKVNIESIPVRIPKNEEQTQIGNFFKQLDDTIALQEKELEALKQTKQAFLQKMFV